MNNMFSKSAIWVVVVLLLLMLYKQFDSHSVSGGPKTIAYSDLLDEVKAKRIKDVVIEGANITATRSDDTKVRSTATMLAACRWPLTAAPPRPLLRSFIAGVRRGQRRDHHDRPREGARADAAPDRRTGGRWHDPWSLDMGVDHYFVPRDFGIGFARVSR